ncbi:MAG TPA: cytochrome P450 [Acidimicrobiales bacterium]
MADLTPAIGVHTDLDFLDPATFDGGVPHPRLAELRAEAPIVWLEPPGGDPCWLVLGHPELIEVSKNPATFSSWERSCFPQDPRNDAELAQVRQMLLNMDPPEHTGFRRIVNRVFTPRMVRELQSSISAHARDVVGSIPDECDFVRQVGVEMSLRVLADVMGIPQNERHLLYGWTERLVGDGDIALGRDPRDFVAALMEMFEYAAIQTAARRAQPTDDVWSLVANAEVDGERLTAVELNRFFQLLATAGNETTRTLISAGFLMLSRHPDQMAWLREDVGGRIDAAVEEMLRFHSPIIQFRRTVTVDTVIGGQQLVVGDKVLLCYSAANRDPRVFDEPECFDITRDPNPHLAFGIGPHFCLGANLARVQARSLFTVLLSQPFALEVTGPPTGVRSVLIDGYHDIPVRKV